MSEQGGTPTPSNREPGALFLGLYNAVYWPYLIGSCVGLFGPALAIFLATAPFDKRRKLLHRYTSYWGAHYLAWAPFASVEVLGKEHGRDGKAYVFVSNHQSMVDILACFATHLDYKWVSKAENFYAPFLGWNMYLNGYIPLKRGHLPSIMKMFRKCEAVLKGGESIFVFPEGTRSPDGNLQKFFRGAFVLSARNKAPVVPVVILGTGDILKKGGARIVPQAVTVSVLPPVDPADYGFDDEKLRDAVHAKMATELARLRARRAG